MAPARNQLSTAVAVGIGALMMIGAALVARQALAPPSFGLEAHHDHAHHDHDHDHRRTHVCVHDHIVHPEIKHNPSAIAANVVPIEPFAPVEDVVAGVSTSRRGRRASTTVTDSAGGTQDVDTWGGNPDSADPTHTYSASECTSEAAQTKGAIRIQLVDGGISDLSADYQNYLNYVLMPAVVDYFQTTITVAQLASTLKCAQTGTVGDVTIPSSCNSAGYSNTDFILVVGASQSSTCNASSSTLAYAGPLETMSCNRPVVGYIHWCTSALTTTDTTTTQHDLQFSTGLHETIHALGFTTRMFAYYRKTTSTAGDPRTTRDSNGVPNAGTLSTYLSENGTAWEETYNMYQPDTGYFKYGVTYSTLGHNVTMFTSGMSNTLAAAQTQFGCSSLSGVELENQGTSGSFGSHWEKRIFGDELMTAVVSGFKSPLSKVTLDFLKDTGFYDIATYTAAYNSTTGDLSAGVETNLWLNNAGCDAATTKCINSSYSENSGTAIDNNTWCTQLSPTTDQDACTYDGSAKGYCNLGSNSYAASSEYQYFSSTSSYGAIDFADYCPFVSYSSNRICSDVGDGIAEGSTVAAIGQTYGSASRCFTSSLWDLSYSPVQTKGAACYSYECIASDLISTTIVKGTQNYVLNCYTADRWSTKTVSGMSGTFTCPDPTHMTVCGNEAAFASLSALTVDDVAIGASYLDLLPDFANYEGTYRVNVGTGVTTVDITPTTTSSSGLTLTVNGATTTSGSAASYTLASGLNTIPIVVTNSADSTKTKTYNLKVYKATGDTSNIATTLTLNTAFSTATGLGGTDNSVFLAAVKAEIVSLLKVVNTSQLEMYRVTECTASSCSGPTEVQFVFHYDAGNTTAPDPAGMDSTLQAFVLDLDSTMYNSATYTYLSTAAAHTSAVAVACDATCSNADCDAATGSCSTSSSSDTWYANYPGILWGGAVCLVLIVAGIVFCIYKKWMMDQTQVQEEKVKHPSKVSAKFTIMRGAGRGDRHDRGAGHHQEQQRLTDVNDPPNSPQHVGVGYHGPTPDVASHKYNAPQRATPKTAEEQDDDAADQI